MKRSIVVTVLAVALGLILVGSSYAWRGGYGMGYGAGANVENVKEFQKETLNLRDELMTKRIELQNEFNKPVSDVNRIATLKKEIIDLQAKIQTVAEKHGVAGSMKGRMGGMMMGRGMMGRGMMGSGMGMCGCPMCN